MRQPLHRTAKREQLQLPFCSVPGHHLRDYAKKQLPLVTQTCFPYSQVGGISSDAKLKSPAGPREYLKVGNSTSFSWQLRWKLQCGNSSGGPRPNCQKAGKAHFFPGQKLIPGLGEGHLEVGEVWGHGVGEMRALTSVSLLELAAGGECAARGGFPAPAAGSLLATQMNNLSRIWFDLLIRQMQLF